MLAIDVRDQKQYAIKVVTQDDALKVNHSTFMRILNNEVKMLKRLDHQNIVHMVDFNLNGEVLRKKNGKTQLVYYIVLELI